MPPTADPLNARPGAVSACAEAPRRYRGKDTIYWMIQLGLHGPEYGLDGLTVEQLPSPAARFMCNPLLSGADGGHDIHLRDLGRRGVRLHGHLEAADDGDLVFSDDLPERLAMVGAGFRQRLQPMLDAYIAAGRTALAHRTLVGHRRGRGPRRGVSCRAHCGAVSFRPTAPQMFAAPAMGPVAPKGLLDPRSRPVPGKRRGERFAGQVAGVPGLRGPHHGGVAVAVLEHGADHGGPGGHEQSEQQDYKQFHL